MLLSKGYNILNIQGLMDTFKTEGMLEAFIMLIIK